MTNAAAGVHRGAGEHGGVAGGGAGQMRRMSGRASSDYAQFVGVLTSCTRRQATQWPAHDE